jgi:hypothetical protein
MAELNHKEKDEIIKELKAKLKEYKQLEQATKATAKDLSQLSIGVQKAADGKYELVHVRYDTEKNAAAVEKIEKLDTHDFAIAAHKARELLGEKILRKARGDKYAE